jgi:hypothetical protein
VRRSVQGIPFRYSLPLPISESHWERVRGDADLALITIVRGASLDKDTDPVHVIFRLLNDVIIRLNKETEQKTYKSPIYSCGEKAKSTRKCCGRNSFLFRLPHKSPLPQSQIIHNRAIADPS